MYNLDLDCNGAPIFTKKNFDIIDCILRYDSNYRATTDKSYPDYCGTYADVLSNGGKPHIPTTKDKLRAVIKSIDKMNSTHLSVQNGVEITTDYIWNLTMSVLEQRLSAGDDSLVMDIANAVINNGGTRINLSFASKFCAYVSKIVFDLDNFCIYDNVIQSVLPYYHFTYAGAGTPLYYKKNRANNNVSDISRIIHTEGYSAYRKTIDETLNGIQFTTGMSVTYEMFDHLIWYYYKGSEKLRTLLLNTLP